MRHLIMALEAPLMALGGETIDNYGVTRSFPAASMLTGLLANALGWRRVDREQHQRLQDRMVFAARIDREPASSLRITDFQTAQLGARDRGWTTRGVPEGRDGGPNTYNAPHLRYRDYYADMRVTVALRLEPSEEVPLLDDLAVALEEPARPLFIGRKPCLPSAPLFGGFSDSDTCLAALLTWPLVDGPSAESHPASQRALWPDGEGKEGLAARHTYMLTDERRWTSGLHGGGRMVCEGAVPREMFSASAEASAKQEKDGQK